MSNFRLLQLVVFAGICLLILKGSALLFSDVQVLTGAAQLSAQEAAKADGSSEKTSKQEGKGAASPAKKAEAGKVAGPVVADKTPLKPIDYSKKRVLPSSSELDLLESLAVRRKELNVRETQLKLKENLLKAAQQQIDERIAQLKELEAKIQTDLKKQDVLRQGQYQRLVKIYSNMKAKEAARIFNGLDMSVLVDLMRAMKAAPGSQILAKMEPEKARALTMLLAKRDQLQSAPQKRLTGDLPEIKGESLAKNNQ